MALTTETFIKKAKEIHGNKYDYSKVVYTGCRNKVCIICPEHGEFWQVPYYHLAGNGCKKCFDEKRRGKGRLLTTEDFIRRSKVIHGEKYDYSKVDYIDCRHEVTIICPEHGEFKQKPYKHLNGHGCPFCNEKSLEKEVRNYLSRRNITFEEQKKFDWLKYRGVLTLDFYLPESNIGIECQGIQHFEPVEYFGGQSGFDNQVVRDRVKRELCEKAGISLLYYANDRKEYPYDVYTKITDLMNFIEK